MNEAPATALSAQVPVPTWAILLMTMALGPGDTLAASLIRGPEAAQLAAEVSDLKESVAELSKRVEDMQDRDAELMQLLIQQLPKP